MTQVRFVPFSLDQINLIGAIAQEEKIPMSVAAKSMQGLIAKGLVSTAHGLSLAEEDHRFTLLVAELEKMEAEEKA